jgi:hypothetical protein
MDCVGSGSARASETRTPVMTQPVEWVDHLLGAASISSQKRVWACLKARSDPQSPNHLIR